MPGAFHLILAAHVDRVIGLQADRVIGLQAESYGKY